MYTAVKEHLKDPESAIFDSPTEVLANKACIVVNAKNSFGGYTRKQAAFLEKSVSNKWTVEEILDVPCSKQTLQQRLDKQQFADDTLNKVLDILKAKGLIEPDVKHPAEIKDKACMLFLFNISQRAAKLFDAKSDAEKISHQNVIDEGMNVVEQGICGSLKK
jgi:hypothetical protein